MKKPWNIPDLPVYSLATYSNTVNMNICTYVSAVSMKPKLYTIAIYENTKTLANIQQNEMAVLQLLHQSQYGLVKKLGRTSGLEYNKENYLTKKGLIEKWQTLHVLKNTSARVLLKATDSIKTGDHYLYVFEMIANKSYNVDYLQINQLREMKIIRG